MLLTTRTSALALTTLTLAFGATACGSSDDTSNVSASGTSASSDQSAGGGRDMSAMGMGAPSRAEQKTEASTMRMRVLGSTVVGDQKVEIHMSEPVTFSVYEGDKLVKHAPTQGQNAHLMVLLSDRQSGDRLPDSTITLRIADEAGKIVSSGPQYPMIGMGMGLHYGDNVKLPGSGRYTAQLVIGPPRIGRHADVTGRWNTTKKASIPFTWNGSAR